MGKSRTLVGSRALSADRWKPAWSAIITCSELDDVGDLFEEIACMSWLIAEVKSSYALFTPSISRASCRYPTCRWWHGARGHPLREATKSCGSLAAACSGVRQAPKSTRACRDFANHLGEALWKLDASDVGVNLVFLQ